MRAAACASTLAILAGCAVPGVDTFSEPPPPVHRSERFDAAAVHARRYELGAQAVCEGARRALLGQGYVLTRNERAVLVGSKFFQPDREHHVELKLQVSCVPVDDSDRAANAYVTAWEDQYVVKKSSNSSSLGVCALGSISLPVGGSEDSLVKVGVMTVRDAAFYERLHALIARVLAAER